MLLCVSVMARSIKEPVTMKLWELTAVPPGVVTLIRPDVAKAGTWAVICVDESTLNVAAVALNVTAEAEVRFKPVITTFVFAPPDVGEKPEMTGAGLVCPYTSLRNTAATFVGRAVKNVNPVSTSIWLAEVTYVCQVLLTLFELGILMAMTWVSPI